ncbi:unnamed protein product, partial [Dibothriocephalus latus]
MVLPALNNLLQLPAVNFSDNKCNSGFPKNDSSPVTDRICLHFSDPSVPRGMKVSSLVTPESLVEGTNEWCQCKFSVSPSTIRAGSQLKHYNDLRKAAKFTDTVIVIEDHKFPVHSQLLSISSEYFEHIAFRDFPVAAEIHLDDVTSASNFELLLNFIYSGSLPVAEENFTELYRDSSFFLMPQALDVCRKWLLSQLNIESPNEKALELAVDIILSHGDEEILASVFTILAKDLEKYKGPEMWFLTPSVKHLQTLLPCYNR